MVVSKKFLLIAGFVLCLVYQIVTTTFLLNDTHKNINSSLGSAFGTLDGSVSLVAAPNYTMNDKNCQNNVTGTNCFTKEEGKKEEEKEIQSAPSINIKMTDIIIGNTTSKHRKQLPTTFNKAIPPVPVPDSSNTVIYMVAGGERFRINYDVEILIRSLRVSGNFTGAIVVFVDSDESVNKFTASLYEFKDVYIKNVEKDLYPVDDNGDKIKFLQISMYYKRLKVTGRNYIQENPSLKGSKYALYFDTDVIVTSDMALLFEDIHAKVVAGWNKMMKDGFSSFLCMWKSPGTAPHDGGAWQGGQIFSNFPNSDICMESYKKMIDEMGVNEGSDQKILKTTLKKPNSTCKVIEIPGGKNKGGHHFNLGFPNIIKLQQKVPTITHNTNYRLKYIESEEYWKRFVKTFLGFQIGKNATETVGITNITWEEAMVVSKNELFGVMKRRRERKALKHLAAMQNMTLEHYLAAMQNMTLQNSTSKN